MERVRSQYTNLVKLRLDQASLKRTRKELQRFKNETTKALQIKMGIDVPNVKMPKQPRSITNAPNNMQGFMNNLGLKPKTTVQDSHVKQYEQQLKFVALQQDSIEKFMLSNKLIRQSSEEQKKAIRQQLLATKNAKSLRLEQLKIRTSLQDEAAKRRKINNQMRQQKDVQRGIASTVALTAAGFATISAIRTGASMESMEKSFKVVSKDSQQAAENLAWVRNEAQRLGVPLEAAGKNFSGMIAASSNKMSLDDIKTVFKGVSESGVALGLSSDDISGTLYAVKQMAAKSRISSEELLQQFGERNSYGLQAMANAAVAKGLISSQLSAANREAELLKLMKNGKLLAEQILPQFGVELSKLANKGDELNKFLKDGLNPNLVKASNNFKGLQERFSKGFQPATLHALESFNEQSKELGAVSEFLGKSFGLVAVTVTSAIRLVVAGFSDLSHWLDKTLNLSDSTKDSLYTLGTIATAGGIAFYGLRAAIGTVITSLGLLKRAKSGLTFSDMGGMCGDGIDIDSKGKRKGGRVGKRGRTSLGKAISKGAMRAGGNLALVPASSMVSEMMIDSLRNFDWYRNATEKSNKMFHDMTGSDYLWTDAYWKSKEQQGKIDINLNLNTNGLDGVIDAKVEKVQGNMLENAYMNIQSGGVR